MTDLSVVHRAVLRAIVDTAVPSLASPDGTEDGFWAVQGSDVGADIAVGQLIEALPDEQGAGITQLLDGLAGLGLQHQGRSTREGILGAAMALSPDAAAALTMLRGVACMYAHSLVDGDGKNPLWSGYGYPGPVLAPSTQEPHIRPYVPAEGEALEADVVVVGSGAGGGTIAGVLAAQGHRVVVLEAGGATSERDYRQLEVEATGGMLYRGGMAGTVDGNVALLAGATLGGGTTVNWQNCVRPSAALRREWAVEHGLKDVDTDEFDRHLDAVLTRMKANADCSDLNGPHQRMVEGAERLGWSVHTAVRNVDPATYDPVAAGYTQFGDPSGSKQGTVNTYLRDAYDHGARILVHTRADEVLLTDGHAAGVAATYTDPTTGASRSVRIAAPHVVAACSALETPALLLRSGIGGPAVGKNFYVHPSVGIVGVYADEQRAWWGPPQAAVMDEFRDLGDGYGFLVEGSQFFAGIIAYTFALGDGRKAKEAMSKVGRMSNLLFVLREHAGGRVTIDDHGEAEHHYSLVDPRDIAAFRLGIRTLAQLHEAAGAEEMWLAGERAWKRGDDLEDWISELEQLPVGASGIAMGSAHHMGTARLGTDPTTSVAAPTGELHDTPGVWIGDTSAFPTASGANPMLTCMALAHRTAEHIARSIDAQES